MKKYSALFFFLFFVLVKYIDNALGVLFYRDWAFSSQFYVFVYLLLRVGLGVLIVWCLGLKLCQAKKFSISNLILCAMFLIISSSSLLYYTFPSLPIDTLLEWLMDMESFAQICLGVEIGLLLMGNNLKNKDDNKEDIAKLTNPHQDRVEASK